MRPRLWPALPVHLAQRAHLGDGRPQAAGGDWTAEDEDAFKEPIRAQYEEQGNPYYATARLWDDGVIDPADTRTVLGLALSACANAPVPEPQYGVFRM